MITKKEMLEGDGRLTDEELEMIKRINPDMYEWIMHIRRKNGTD